MQFNILSFADNAEGQLDSGISASMKTLVLKAGEGAEFPQAYSDTATSSGDANTLNSTGIGAKVSDGDFLWNLTDGSHCWAVTSSTNSVATTDLTGGSANIWDDEDEWVVKPFVVTLNLRDSAGEMTAYEKVLIKNRTTDTLTAETRGYDSSSAQTWGSDTYIDLLVIEKGFDGINDAISEISQKQQLKADISLVTSLLDARNWKQSVRVATTVAGTLASDFEDGDTIDGITLATDDRILIKNQASAPTNGIYTVNASGAPTRASDFDLSAEITSAVVAVDVGTVNADLIWQCTSENVTIGSTAINFAEIPTTRSLPKFGGTGADGALNVTSGTTTLDASSENMLVKNYSSINISSGAILALSNKATEGTVLVLKCSGDVTIAGTIDLEGDGADALTVGYSILDDLDTHDGSVGVDGASTTGGEGGAGGTIYSNKYLYTTPEDYRLQRKCVYIACGSGGGPGGNGFVGTAGGGGDGGAGGGGLIIECSGTLTFTGTINANGANGVDGVDAGGDGWSAGGGGGGGASGMVLVLYNTLGSDSGTINTKGGAGGAGGDGEVAGGSAVGGGGGGGGGAYSYAGKDGGNGGKSSTSATVGANGVTSEGAGGGGGGSVSTWTAGAAGGAGGSTDANHYLIVQNTVFV